MKLNSLFIKKWLKNIRPLKSIHFMLMTSLGCYFSRNFQLFNWILSLIVIFFAWQYNIHINDVFDIEIDRIAHKERPLVQKNISRMLSIVILVIILSLVFGISIILGLLSVLMALIYVGSGTLYSVPPIRARQYLIQTIFIGAGSIFAFFLGYFALNHILTGEALLIGLLIFLALSMGTVVKDYQDFEGDKSGNVTTIFTKFGIKKGLIIAYLLLLITFLLPIVLIHHIIDIIFIVGFAILTIFIFKRRKKVNDVFLCYFIVLLYSFLRYEGFF